VVLQNVDCLTALPDCGAVAFASVFEVDEDGEGFLTRGHEVDAAFEHVDEVLDLLVAFLRILFMRAQIQTRPALIVIPKYKLLPRLILLADIISCVALDTILPSPDQRCL